MNGSRLLPGARCWFCAISVPKLLAVSRLTLLPLCSVRSQCSRAQFLPPNHGRLPTILARLGSEPPIPEISKQNEGMQAPQGSLHRAPPQVLTSYAPMALLLFPGRITRL